MSEKPTFLSKDTYFPRKEGREGKGNIYSRPAGRSHSLTTPLQHRSQSDFNPPRFKHLWLPLPPPLVVGAVVLVHSPIVGDHDGD